MLVRKVPPREVEFSREGINSCHSGKGRLIEWIELPVPVKRIYIYNIKTDTYAFKIPSLTLVSSWKRGRIYSWQISQSGFDLSFENLACPATQKIWDTTKQSVCGCFIYTKSNVKLGGFRSQLQASFVSSHTEELCCNKTVCLWMTIYTPPTGVEQYGEGIYDCRSHNAKLFERIEHSGIQ